MNFASSVRHVIGLPMIYVVRVSLNDSTLPDVTLGISVLHEWQINPGIGYDEDQLGCHETIGRSFQLSKCADSKPRDIMKTIYWVRILMLQRKLQLRTLTSAHVIVITSQF